MKQDMAKAKDNVNNERRLEMFRKAREDTKKEAQINLKRIQDLG